MTQDGQRMSTEEIIGETALVWLVHGLFMTGHEFFCLRRRLGRAGWRSRRFIYRSRRERTSSAASRLVEAIHDDGGHAVLLGHSLGGRVVLEALAQMPQEFPLRAVLLGTPIQASRVAQRVMRFGWGRWSLGSAGCVLPNHLSRWPMHHEIAMIAGNRPIGSGRLFGLGSVGNDGLVAIAETRHPGLRDHQIVRATHLGLLCHRQAADMVTRFYRTGRLVDSNPDP